MKSNLIIIGVLIASGAWMANASAQDETKPTEQQSERQTRRNQFRERTIQQFDKDGDGKLNDEERKAAEEAREKRLLERFDADKDGKLSDEERKKAEAESLRGRREPITPEVLKKFDKDGDGSLNEEERKAAREAREKETLEKYDADKDGKLSDEERRKAREESRSRRQADRAGTTTKPVAPPKPDAPAPK